MATSQQPRSTTATTPATSSGGDDKRPYFGKCQYKTGKCFNERTLKRNGDAHSLCEEHRIKQNLIQRRSDRKYQTVHAIRRRERSQRRAVLKKQVSMAVAQQLFYEHQQQKSMGIQHLTAAGHLPPLPAPLAPVPGHALHLHHSSSQASSLPLHSLHHHHHHSHQNHHHSNHQIHHGGHPLHPIASLAPPIQIPSKMDLSHFVTGPVAFLPSSEGLASPILSFASASSTRSFSNGVTVSESTDRDAKMEDESERDDDDEEDASNCESFDDEDVEDVAERNCERQHAQMLQQRRKNQFQQRKASGASATVAAIIAKNEDSSPTGIDDFAPDSFLSICANDEEGDAAYANLVPIMSSMSEKEMWTEDDIEFLQSVLLT
ncbi:hypothetical protein PybrP1_009823 [[Pythium] brassicae (nom. inval.)]|nr:hypothetical protein PybrP1_009823 [[Pythium] brassicae (nom. inval.)]